MTPRCVRCDRDALIVHSIGECGYALCAEHANERTFCLGCGALWMEEAA